jgi:phosphotransferase system enzyme I (PtsI)
MAVDRGNEKVAYLHDPFHPAILRLIKLTIDNAIAAGIPVGMCGEMAADPVAAVMLAGMGMNELSMSCVAIPAVKRAIRNVDIATARDIAATVMKIQTSGEVAAYLSARVRT